MRVFLIAQDFYCTKSASLRPCPEIFIRAMFSSVLSPPQRPTLPQDAQTLPLPAPGRQGQDPLERTARGGGPSGPLAILSPLTPEELRGIKVFQWSALRLCRLFFSGRISTWIFLREKNQGLRQELGMMAKDGTQKKEMIVDLLCVWVVNRTSG